MHAKPRIGKAGYKFIFELLWNFYSTESKYKALFKTSSSVLEEKNSTEQEDITIFPLLYKIRDLKTQWERSFHSVRWGCSLEREESYNMFSAKHSLSQLLKIIPSAPQTAPNLQTSPWSCWECRWLSCSSESSYCASGSCWCHCTTGRKSLSSKQNDQRPSGKRYVNSGDLKMMGDSAMPCRKEEVSCPWPRSV